jgi:hypothetical protein
MTVIPPRTVPSADPTRPYLVVDDVTTRIAALVVLRVVGADGVPLGAVVAGCQRDGTAVRVHAGGYVVVVGRPTAVFPGLASGPDALTVDLTAQGREALHLAVAIPQNAALPVRPADVLLPGRAVSLVGQVRRIGAGVVPLAGSKVRCLADPAVASLHPLSLRVGLRTNQPATTPVIPAGVTEAGVVHTATQDAEAGSITVALSARSGLAAGVTVRLGTPDRAQLAEVIELVPPVAGAGRVRLARPLIGTLPNGSPVRRATVAAAGAASALARDARAGDGLLALAADLAADFVTVDGDTYPVGAVTDGDGYYRLPGVRGVHAVAVKATKTGLAGTQPVTIVHPDYRQTTNVVDLGVKP